MISRARRKRTTLPRRNTITSLRKLRSERPALVSRILWLLAVAFTLVTFTWQDKTGPTYPLEGEIATAAGPVHFNKVLLSLLAWGIAAYLNRGERRSRMAVCAAGVVTLLVYFIPHSMFGSEYDYRPGKGQGTAG